jgi:putative hydroxymethylpyrimidine transporter CytX
MAGTIQKELEVSHWGIERVPEQHRKLTGFDLGVLWGDLAVGLLVIVAGALLTAPPEQFGFGLSLPAATAAIVLGSAVGCLLLGIGGVIGTREAKPTMVLLRPVLGTKGSWIPTLLNVAQLVGWTAFELWAMALVGDKLGQRLFGFSSFAFWLIAFSIVVLALSLWGPLGVVHHWMEKFGAWLVGAIGLTISLALLSDLGELWSLPGSGGAAIFGVPMDIVIALPVSWIPLVADYNRFSSRPRGSFWGTTGGYLVANIWFYGLGALLVLRSPDVSVSPEGIALAILGLAGVSVTGSLLLAGLLVGETDEAFADVYSGAISLRNILPNVSNRVLIVGVTAIGAILAGRFTMLSYETFLFLLGSVFLPLLGVWFADYFVLKVRSDEGRAFRWESLVGWVAGFVVYHWIAPTPLGWWSDFVVDLFGEPLSARINWLGASLPSFAVAFALHVVIGSLVKRRKGKSPDAARMKIA